MVSVVRRFLSRPVPQIIRRRSWRCLPLAVLAGLIAYELLSTIRTIHDCVSPCKDGQVIGQGDSTIWNATGPQTQTG